MFPSNYEMRIPNRYPIKALQRFGAVKFAMSVHIGLNIKVEGDKIEYLDYYNHNDERKRVLMSCADKIENLLEDSYHDLQSQIDYFPNDGLWLDVE